MTDAAVIQATFADWRTVKGRKQLQLIFEVPLERQAEILSILGAPNAADAKWCAIALLNLKGGGASNTARLGHSPASDGEANNYQPPSSQSEAGAAKPVRQRTPWDELTATKQAVLRCKEPGFQQWVIEQEGFDEEEDKELNAARYVRKECNVNTRGDLVNNQRARAMWNAIEDRYLDSVMAARAFG